MAKKIYANIELLATPHDATHLVNKGYVDSAITKKVKDPVLVVCGDNFDGAYDRDAKSLTQSVAAKVVIDGEEVPQGSRVLLIGQTDATQNGIYVLEVAGVDGGDAAVFVRADDFNATENIYLNCIIPVQSGNANADVMYVLANDNPVVLDTDVIKFARIRPENGAIVATAEFEGDGATNEFSVTHGLGTSDVVYRIVDTDGNDCHFDVRSSSENVMTVKSSAPVSEGEKFRITIVG